MPEQGLCRACNYDLDWLIRYPSILLWVDKILLTPQIRHTIASANYPDKPVLAECIKLIFDVIEDQGLLEIIDAQEVMPTGLSEHISQQVEKDRLLLSQQFPNSVRLGEEERVPGQIFVDGQEYCTTHVWSIYAGLVLARVLDARCLFSDRVLNYCKFKFGISQLPREAKQDKMAAFQEIFQAYLPEQAIFPTYVFEKRCSSCVHEDQCSKAFLSELEQNLRAYMKWRDYDELHQIRAIITRIAESREKYARVLDPATIVSEFREEERKALKRVRSLFPKVQRWTNMTTIISIPVAVIGASTGSALVTVAGAGTAGLATIAGKFVDILSSRYKWVGFANKGVKLKE